VVEETFKYAATPEDAGTASTAWVDIQTCREVYNHALTQAYRPRPDDDKPSYRDMQNKLTDWKDRWPEWRTVYSKCLQMAVRRLIVITVGLFRVDRTTECGRTGKSLQ
jgi:putative transposase